MTKVPREVEDYIRKRVEARYKTKLDEIDAAREVELDKVRRIQSELAEIAKEKLAQIGIIIKDSEISINFCGYHGVQTAECEELWQKRCDLNAIINEKVSEIKLKLVLKNTKDLQALDDLISET